MTITDFLKALYGDKESMTLNELTQAAEGFKGAKFVDLKDGGYVDEGKYSDVSAKLFTANSTIKTLREAAQAFDGVDVADLQRQLNDEKAERKKDRQNWELRAALTGAGCKDPDYLLFKLGDTVEFAEDGSLKDKDGLLETCKKDFAAMFPADPPAGTGSSGNFRRDRNPAQSSQREQLEKQINDLSLPLAQRIYAKEQLQNLREDE